MNKTPISSGTNLAGYRVGALLARGSYGLVYQAVRLADNEEVVVKEYYPNIEMTRAKDQSLSIPPEKKRYFERHRSRFRSEHELLSELSHPGIVSCIDNFDRLNTSFYVMPRLSGETLAARMKRRLLHEWEVLQLVRGLGEALGYLHGAGYCHLDLKPNNVFLTHNHGVVIIDFGTAWDQRSLNNGSARTVLTEKYAAYELFEKREVGPWSDLYALGCILYKLIAEQYPQSSWMRYKYRERFGYDPYSVLTKENAPRFSTPLISATNEALSLDRDARKGGVAMWANRYELSIQPVNTKASENIRSLEAADDAFIRGQVSAAESQYLQLAALGDIAAMRALESLYTKNTNGKSDPEKAIFYAKKLMEGGSSSAAYRVARLLKQYPELASRGDDRRYCYQVSAHRGYAEGMYRLGLICYRRAERASQKNMRALFVEGEFWLRRAAVAGVVGAQIRLAKIMAAHAPVSEHAEWSHVWYLFAAHRGDVSAQFELANMFEVGVKPVIERDSEQALRWYKAAAKNGHPEASSRMDRCR